jgi:hypothetical protein
MEPIDSIRSIFYTCHLSNENISREIEPIEKGRVASDAGGYFSSQSVVCDGEIIEAG